MSAIKQIEVNGTTYDINTFGSDLPVICETYASSGSNNYEGIASGLHDKHYSATGTDYTYTPIEMPFIFLRTQDGSSERVIVIAAPEESNSGE